MPKNVSAQIVCPSSKNLGFRWKKASLGVHSLWFSSSLKCHGNLGSRLPNDGFIWLVVILELWNFQDKLLFDRRFEWRGQIWPSVLFFFHVSCTRTYGSLTKMKNSIQFNGNLEPKLPWHFVAFSEYVNFNLTTFFLESSVINKWQKSTNGISGYILEL
jgi:hypothetical protein